MLSKISFDLGKVTMLVYDGHAGVRFTGAEDCEMQITMRYPWEYEHVPSSRYC